jgi:hypothetical protein
MCARARRGFWLNLRERRVDLPLAHSEPGLYLLVTRLRRTHSTVVTASPVDKTSGIYASMNQNRAGLTHPVGVMPENAGLVGLAGYRRPGLSLRGSRHVPDLSAPSGRNGAPVPIQMERPFRR